MAARLRERYVKNVVPALTKEFGYKNHMAVPKIEKISINIGLGEATQNGKLMDGAVAELVQIAGQKPVITKAAKSISQFKLREGQAIGCMVTLRGDRMYEFLDRLVNVALPRVGDFRGVSSKSFDGRGNYTLGVKDQLIFSGNRLRQSGKDQGDEHFHHHDGPHRRGRPGVVEADGNAVPAVEEKRERTWPQPPRSPKT
jgi:large subunit ribosomal protein L5